MTSHSGEQAESAGLFLLEGVVKPYAWGSREAGCLVAELAASAPRAVSSVPLSEAQSLSQSLGQASSDTVGDTVTAPPWAEIWFGTHPRGDAIAHPAEGAPLPLSTLLSDLPAQPGFMLKALSVGAPLSIQVHPDEGQAELLFKRDPGRFPDPLAKSEIAVAITELELFRGFDSHTELVRRLHPLGLLGADNTLSQQDTPQDEENGSVINKVTNRVLTLSPSERASLVERCILFLSESGEEHDQRRAGWIKKIVEHFGDEDPGVLFSLLLRLEVVPPGMGVYIQPGTPHSYLSGDLLEVLSASDNVIRFGLTEKEVDRELFLECSLRPASPLPDLFPLLAVEAAECGPDNTKDSATALARHAESAIPQAHLPGATFSVRSFHCLPGHSPHLLPVERVSIAVCLSGGLTIFAGDRHSLGAGGTELGLIKGQVALLLPTAAPYGVSGEGVLLCASGV